MIKRPDPCECRQTNSRTYDVNTATKLKACEARAKCFVVMFFKSALLVASAPRISCGDRKLKSFSNSSSAEMTFCVMLRMSMISCSKNSMSRKIVIAGLDKMYFCSSMMTLQILSFITKVPLTLSSLIFLSPFAAFEVFDHS